MAEPIVDPFEMVGVQHAQPEPEMAAPGVAVQ
jgi:hypothetical protein